MWWQNKQQKMRKASLCIKAHLYIITINWLTIRTSDNKKAELSQRWPRDAPYIWEPCKFSEVPDKICQRLLFPKFVMGFVQNLKFVALPAPQIIWGTPKIGQSRICPRSLFSKIFNWLLFGWTLWIYWPNFEVRNFTRSSDNSGGCEPPI